MKILNFFRKDPAPVEPLAMPPKYPGVVRLSRWFGLSRSWCVVLPRVQMTAMPSEWQGRMADLLEEASNAFPNAPSEFIVRGAGPGGRMGKVPAALKNYRYPDFDQLRAWSNEEPRSAAEFTECIMVEVGPHISRAMVSEHLSFIGAHFGDSDFSWDRAAARALATEIEAANAE